MAVTKIRRISSWTLLITALITVVVFGIFFAGGISNPGEEMKEYIYTDLLLGWSYVIFIAALLSTLLFAVWQLVGSFRNDAKSALMSIAAIVLFAVLLLATFAIGDGTPLLGLNADSQKHNVDFWLKVTDMWIYSCYVMILLIVLAVIAGSIRKIIKK